ncbi:hypothetical protein CGRA01v4_00579 [Colletotrichum graminicola]|nr:hypothetical protein CGRA01v4_00579 [Colletotrichum graminicola]
MKRRLYRCRPLGLAQWALLHTIFSPSGRRAWRLPQGGQFQMHFRGIRPCIPQTDPWRVSAPSDGPNAMTYRQVPTCSAFQTLGQGHIEKMGLSIHTKASRISPLFMLALPFSWSFSRLTVSTCSLSLVNLYSSLLQTAHWGPA